MLNMPIDQIFKVHFEKIHIVGKDAGYKCSNILLQYLIIQFCGLKREGDILQVSDSRVVGQIVRQIGKVYTIEDGKRMEIVKRYIASIRA